MDRDKTLNLDRNSLRDDNDEKILQPDQGSQKDERCNTMIIDIRAANKNEKSIAHQTSFTNKHYRDFTRNYDFNLRKNRKAECKQNKKFCRFSPQYAILFTLYLLPLVYAVLVFLSIFFDPHTKSFIAICIIFSFFNLVVSLIGLHCILSLKKIFFIQSTTPLLLGSNVIILFVAVLLIYDIYKLNQFSGDDSVSMMCYSSVLSTDKFKNIKKLKKKGVNIRNMWLNDHKLDSGISNLLATNQKNDYTNHDTILNPKIDKYNQDGVSSKFGENINHIGINVILDSILKFEKTRNVKKIDTDANKSNKYIIMKDNPSQGRRDKVHYKITALMRSSPALSFIHCHQYFTLCVCTFLIVASVFSFLIMINISHLINDILDDLDLPLKQHNESRYANLSTLSSLTEL